MPPANRKLKTRTGQFPSQTGFSRLPGQKQRSRSGSEGTERPDRYDGHTCNTDENKEQVFLQSIHDNAMRWVLVGLPSVHGDKALGVGS